MEDGTTQSSFEPRRCCGGGDDEAVLCSRVGAARERAALQRNGRLSEQGRRLQPGARGSGIPGRGSGIPGIVAAPATLSGGHATRVLAVTPKELLARLVVTKAATRGIPGLQYMTITISASNLRTKPVARRLDKCRILLLVVVL
jgi:hypothetical protein